MSSIWPQVIVIALMAIAIMDNLEHWGEPEKGTRGPSGIVAIAITALLLWWGGFWVPLLGGGR